MPYRRDVTMRISGGDITVPAEFTIHGNQPTTRSVRIPAESKAKGKARPRQAEITLPVEIKKLAMVAISTTADVTLITSKAEDAKPRQLSPGQLLFWTPGCGYDCPLESQKLRVEAAADAPVDGDGNPVEIVIGIHLL